MLTGIHILLTYQCTSECDHCFLHCAPRRQGTFSLQQLRALLRQAKALGTIRTVYFEGGEPFLYYPILVEGVRMAREAGFEAGIVTNAYWANSLQDALHWLGPLADLGISDLSISDDDYHRADEHDCRSEYACLAAGLLGIPASTICIIRPGKVVSIDPAERGKPVIGGSVLFKGRAAEKLTAGLPTRPLAEFTTCPHEDLLAPERVHVDPFGNVHLCQGISVGNCWQTPLAEMFHGYDGLQHPIAGPLLRGGPHRLFQEYKLPAGAGFVDECHACYLARKALLPRFPDSLAPKEVYGL
ncbi:MAG TPA: radical SAM protein [Terriglobales bacterium]|nr:radical SAM protein [Terriglobales bacterium]